MKTFKIGGIHPEGNKITADKPIEIFPLPDKVVVPVSQSLGAPSKAVVEKGEVVKTGQLIAKGESFISANVHSPVSGKIAKIDSIIDASGYKRPAIFIDVEGDEWEETIDRTSTIIREIKADRDTIIRKINEMGVVGVGGATFPSHVKLMVPDGKKAEYLLINGVECEPYLTADHRLMLERGEELFVGIQILKKALGVNGAFIGIERNKPDAIDHLTHLSKEFPGIEVVSLKVKYPQGGEKQLIKAVVNREVPSGKLPIEVGCVVYNVGTTLAVYEAIQKNKPLIERIVTVTGKSLSNPSNYLVRIGTPISALLDYAGGLPDDTGKVISGGPMMGKALASLDAPVVKGTSGVLVMPQPESKRVPVKSCIRCGRCISVCPMGLEPVLLAQLSENLLFERAEKERIMDCIECGSCHFTCPAGRPLLDFLRLGKNKTGIMIRNRGKK